MTKVKHKDGKTTLLWTTTSPDGKTTIEHTLTSSEDPEPEFEAAMTALLPHVLALLELPEAYGEGMRATGLSLSYGEDDRMGAVVTCLKDLEGANSPLVLNTPHLTEPDLDSDAEQPSLDQGFLKAIDEVIARAKRFVEGHRAQGDLFDEAA